MCVQRVWRKFWLIPNGNFSLGLIPIMSTFYSQMATGALKRVTVSVTYRLGSTELCSRNGKTQ